nr:phosphotransferase [Vagococcus fluvialis]
MSYVKNRLETIKTQKIVKQHGDFHPGNLILTPQNNIVVIDFNRWDLGDPFEEFLKISLFTVETSPVFALGQIEGYFNNQIPDIFWEQLKFYSLHTSLFSIVWAEKFGANDVANMITRYERIYQDYFTKDTLVPRWVEKALKELKRSSI